MKCSDASALALNERGAVRCTGGTSWVRVNAGIDGKPIDTGVGASSIPAGTFAAWWDDGTLTNVAPYTIPLTSAVLHALPPHVAGPLLLLLLLLLVGTCDCDAWRAVL